MRLKMSSGKRQPFCLGLNVFTMGLSVFEIPICQILAFCSEANGWRQFSGNVTSPMGIPILVE